MLIHNAAQLVYLLFCTKKNGWGWNNFMKEANAGKGRKFPAFVRGYVSYGIPVLIIIVYLKGYWDMFSTKPEAQANPLFLWGWMAVAVLFLAFIGWIVFGGNKERNK